MNILFLTKKEIAIAGAGGKTKKNEKEELDAIMRKNGYRKGYCGSRVMKDDIDPENDTRP